MGFITYSQLREYKTTYLLDKLVKTASKEEAINQAFLSYSSKDKDHIEEIIGFFKSYDADIYIDRKDESLPNKPSHKTAAKLYESITKCPRFVVLISANSKESKWIPWELGVAHGKKDLGKIALLPIATFSEEDEWIEQEYLGLYPRVLFRKKDGKIIHKVFDPRDEKLWDFKTWLFGANIK